MRYPLTIPEPTLDSLKNRHSLLLDSNVWIRLADDTGTNTDARQAKDNLLKLCNKELLFCPLCPPTIMELCKQSGPSLHRTAALMEVLSLNITFRDIQYIFDKEIDHFITYLFTNEVKPLSDKELYGPLLTYLSTGFKIEYLDTNISVEQRLLADHCSGITERLSVTEFVAWLQNTPFPEFYAPPYRAANIRRWEVTSNDKRKMLRIEQEYIAKQIVVPKLQEKISLLPPEASFYITKKISSLPKSKKYRTAIEHILQYMPALSAFAQIMAVSGYDTNRKDKPQDFYDRSLMIYGLSYAGPFVAIDRWIQSLMHTCQEESFLGSFGYIANMRDLNAYLHNFRL